MTHIFSVNESALQEVKDGTKTLFIVKNDNDYRLNDYVLFQCPENRTEIELTICEIAEGKYFGVKSGYVAFVVKPKE